MRCMVLCILAIIPCSFAATASERRDELREWVYRHTDVAADKSYLLPQSEYPLWRMRYDEILHLFSDDVGGVWCAGVATTLYKAYRDAGYNAWVLSYGVSGIVTHAVTLVEVDGVLYAEDAYFNLSLPMPFFEYLQKLASGEAVPSVESSPALRDVHLQGPEAVNVSWITMGQTNLQCRQSANGAYTCRARTSVDAFIANYTSVDAAFNFLEEQGHPRRLDFLLLYPFAITGPEGYLDDPKTSPLLARIVDITGRMGGDVLTGQTK